MKNALQYSMIAMPLAFAGIPLYLYAPDYYTRDLGMSIGLLGALLLILRLFDAIQDPIIGYLTDRHSEKRGSIIALGIGLLTFGLGLILCGYYAFISLPLWFMLGMLCAVTGFSMISINLNMIGGFVTNDPAMRTQYSGWREAFLLLGLLIAVILPTALQQQDIDIHHSYQITFIVFLGLVLITIFGFFAFLKRHPNIGQNSSAGFSWKKMVKNSQSRFFITCALSQLATAFPAVLVLFFIKDYLQAEDYTGAYLLAYFAAGALLMPLWIKLANKIGKMQTWRLSMILACSAFIWAATLSPGDVYAFGIICLLSGLALGADLALPPAILADRLTDRHKIKDDASMDDSVTSYYATYSFISKAVLGLAGGIAFLLLDLNGFEADAPDNSQTALTTILVLYTILPCALKMVAAWSITRLLKRDEHIQTDRTKNNETDYFERSVTHEHHGIY